MTADKPQGARKTKFRSKMTSGSNGSLVAGVHRLIAAVSIDPMRAPDAAVSERREHAGGAGRGLDQISLIVPNRQSPRLLVSPEQQRITYALLCHSAGAQRA